MSDFLMRSKKIVGLAVAFGTFIPPALAAPSDDVDEIVLNAMKQWEIPGTAIAVVKDGKVIYAKGYGIREAGRIEKVDENTIFGLGSVTKSFNATAAAMLVDEGKLDWDRSAIDYLPSLHFSDPWITAHATVRDLGAMRLGIDGLLNYMVVRGDVDRTVRTARYIPSQVPFRTYLYSNTAYTVLGKLVEEQSGRNWDDFITDRVLRPLEMTRSFSSEYQFVKRENLAHCWVCVPSAGTPSGAQALNDPTLDVAAPHGLISDAKKGRASLRWQVLPWRSDRAVLPAGMIYSSVADLSKYVMFHLSEGEHAGRRLVSERQINALHSLQTTIPSTDPHGTSNRGMIIDGYGLGWMVGQYRGRRLISHGGGRVGFGSEIWMFPEEKLGIVFLQNLDYQSSIHPAKILGLIANQYLGIATDSEDAEKALARPADWKPISARPQQCRRGYGQIDRASAARYPGNYHSDLMGGATVTQDGNRLSVTFDPQSVADLIPAESGNFTACFRGYQPYPLAFRFSLDPSGKPLGFVLDEGQLGISPLKPESQAVIFERLP